MHSGTNSAQEQPSRIEIASASVKTVKQWDSPPTLEEVQELYVHHILTSCSKPAVAARILGIGRTTLYRIRLRNKFT